MPAGRGGGHGLGLAKGLFASIPGVLLPYALVAFVLPRYEEAGAALPMFTLAWLKWYPLAWLLPLAVFGAWLALRKHPLRDRATLVAGLLGSILVDAVSVVAAWLPLLALPGTV